MEQATRFCIAWKTNFPHCGQLKSSPFFLFRGSRYNLHLNFDPISDSYTVTLQHASGCKVLNNTFDISLRLESETDRNTVYAVGSNTKVQYNGQILCEFTLYEINKHLHLNCFEEGSDNGVKIVCTFQDESQTSKITNSSTELDFTRSLQSLSLDLSSLLKDETFPDVKLICGGRTISAHRSVLATRSAVFHAMFRSDMLESKTGVVNVTDMDAPVIDLFLEYVYTGKLPAVSDDETLSSLYVAADKYAVQALRELCRELLVGRLSENNCTSFLTIADAHGDVAFKNAVTSFICQREDVLDSKTWLRFSETSIQATRLANEVYQKFVRSKCKKRRLLS